MKEEEDRVRQLKGSIKTEAEDVFVHVCPQGLPLPLSLSLLATSDHALTRLFTAIFQVPLPSLLPAPTQIHTDPCSLYNRGFITQTIKCVGGNYHLLVRSREQLIHVMEIYHIGNGQELDSPPKIFTRRSRAQM